jgi:hypothetical protein
MGYPSIFLTNATENAKTLESGDTFPEAGGESEPRRSVNGKRCAHADWGDDIFPVRGGENWPLTTAVPEMGGEFSPPSHAKDRCSQSARQTKAEIDEITRLGT